MDLPAVLAGDLSFLAVDREHDVRLRGEIVRCTAVGAHGVLDVYEAHGVGLEATVGEQSLLQLTRLFPVFEVPAVVLPVQERGADCALEAGPRQDRGARIGMGEGPFDFELVDRLRLRLRDGPDSLLVQLAHTGRRPHRAQGLRNQPIAPLEEECSNRGQRPFALRSGDQPEQPVAVGFVEKRRKGARGELVERVAIQHVARRIHVFAAADVDR